MWPTTSISKEAWERPTHNLWMGILFPFLFLFGKIEEERSQGFNLLI
jgi:hypothetical protein